MTSIYLWLPPRVDADRAKALGMIERDYDDHVGQLHTSAASLGEDGYDIEVVLAPTIAGIPFSSYQR